MFESGMSCVLQYKAQYLTPVSGIEGIPRYSLPFFFTVKIPLMGPHESICDLLYKNAHTRMPHVHSAMILTGSLYRI